MGIVKTSDFSCKEIHPGEREENRTLILSVDRSRNCTGRLLMGGFLLPRQEWSYIKWRIGLTEAM
jgi:hypothetical protein